MNTKSLIALALLALAAIALAGCNTVEGAGKDIQAIGEGVSDAADGDD